MIEIDARAIAGVQRLLSGLAENQIPYALNLTLNNAAFALRKTSQDILASQFDRPTRLVTGATRVQKSTKQSLEAMTFIDQGRTPVIAVHETGGRRGNQEIERFLIGKGWLNRGWKAIPGFDMPLDSYGNPRRSVVRQIISDLGAGISGTKGNRRRCFVIPPGWRSHLHPGIYRIRSRSLGRALMSMYVFVASATYRQRLGWEGTMRPEAIRQVETNIGAAVRRAIETAR